MDNQPEVVKEIAERIGRSPHVEKVILFGSRARGDQRERSDIDLAVVGPGITEGEWTDMWCDVNDAATLLSIDLVRFEKAPEHLKKSIAREGVAIYERR